MSKNLLLPFLIAIIGVFAACTADYDTFGESDYCELKDLRFEEQEEGNASLYSAEHKMKFNLVAPDSGMQTWETITVESVDLSHMATVHLVTSKFKTFPSDSLELDSLARVLAYDENEIRKGDKIKLPLSLKLYVMVVSESGEPSLWELSFVVPGVDPAGKNENNETGDEGNSSSSKGKEGETEVSSSSVKPIGPTHVGESDAYIETFVIDDESLEYDVSIDTAAKKVSIVVPIGTDLSVIIFKSTYSDGATAVSTESYLDLTKEVNFDLKAKDGTIVSWIISAKEGAVPPQLKSLRVGEGKVYCDIDAGKKTAFCNMDYNADLDLTALKIVSFEASMGAVTSDIVKGEFFDFSRKKTVTLTNSEGAASVYTVQAGYQYPSMNISSTDWAQDDNKNMYDLVGWDNGNNSFTDSLAVSFESGEVLKMTTTEYMGKTAGGNTFIAYFNPKGETPTNMLKYEDGNELIDFGRPFYGRPEYVEFDMKYDGGGDSCDFYILLENRSRTSNYGKNIDRTSSDVNTLVASAWYRGKTVEEMDDPDVVSIDNASREGFKTIRMKLKYGKPLSGSPIENSSTFNSSLKNSSKGIDNHLVPTDDPDSFDVTHIRIVMAASAMGNYYKGKVGATLYCDAIRLIY